MPPLARSPDGLAFSPAVQAVQSRKRSRAAYAAAAWPIEISAALAEFVAAQTSIYLATASSDGQPYIQHRGGPAGFLRVLDARTLAFADFRGNRQYISTGNLAENDRVHLFLMDYEHRRRIKVWGRARVVDDDPAFVARLMPTGTRAKADQAIVVSVEAWDMNCPSHIPQRFDAEQVAEALAWRDARIDVLEAEVAALRRPDADAPTRDDPSSGTPGSTAA
jgi:uncharacterized protein